MFLSYVEDRNLSGLKFVATQKNSDTIHYNSLLVYPRVHAC